MKHSWVYIRFILIIGLIVFLFGFAKKRNKTRNLTNVEVTFVDENSPFITLETVNKLLIQNQDSVTGMPKERVVLKEMEERLNQNDMIREAQVFMSVDGALGAKIEQRRPIARVTAAPDYYIDEDGKRMPLSTVYTARVPLVTGAVTDDFSKITPLLLELEKDAFMNSSVIGLHVQKNGKVVLRLRKHDLKVVFGQPIDIEKKIQNFKAFYKKTKEDKMLKSYKTVNLTFGNQVVATKK
ncbi:cell division protein FtsQ/DivIB [Luteirhabdus pelagi]|uniref:cell division protein FtsQ/DivIB n=1 Tax=Luteirhabdus pelagi TaxID=2792783 RepID=UPI00193A216F|nr:cell division protein FtsQ/DivIB [Luteirhabdus pelagi]